MSVKVVSTGQGGNSHLFNIYIFLQWFLKGNYRTLKCLLYIIPLYAIILLGFKKIKYKLGGNVK